jgi:formate hydrogenlyase subunit 6/NADH:ubiquinone oxidoreductase subunit I
MAYNVGDACTGCGAGAKLCPVFAITGEKNSRHTINEKRCVECGVCGRICVKNAISDSTGKVCVQVKRSQWSKPVIKTANCSACSICVNDCTPGALAISMPQFRGDINVFAQLALPQKCIGCAICESHCPLGVITMEAAS